MTRPDYDKAATKALEIILEYGITTTPISPLPVLKKMAGVKVRSLTDFSESLNLKRDSVRVLFGQNMDAMTFHVNHPKIRYVVFYNQRLPLYTLQRGLARELGHIVLEHDGQRLPEDVRMEEAFCFAHHFLSPRPLIRAVQDAGIQMTVDQLGSMTGCYERCLKGIRRIPATHVPAELNRKVRERFRECITEFIELEKITGEEDDMTPADFGTFMDGYTE